ncbi:hypothetical protein ACPPVS_09595 [Cellulomonas sp. McL0617]|uniref:hypothetical protein n=1 Tax=Cellulomonas sp. McL0617 TaxID=3415675 RepID=UPI003CE84A9C
MAGAKKSTWIGGTAFAAVLIMAAAWFVLISPQLANASETRSEAEQTRQQNEVLAMQVSQLKAEFAKLPDYKAQLAVIQQQIPTDAMLSDYLRQLDQIALAHSVTITSITPSSPTVVIPASAPVTAAPAPATDGSAATNGTAAATDGTAAPAAPAAPATGAPTGFTSIQFSIDATGSYDNTLAFMNDLQNGTARLFLVTGFTGTALQAAPSSGGKPAINDGDQDLIVTGYTYVLPDALAVPAPVDPNAATPPLPGAVPGKNPMVKVSG